MNKKMHIYHYCSQYQRENGSIDYWDGIAKLGNEIATMEDYAKLKQEIANLDEKHVVATNITIISLSKLGVSNG
jgi:hypothetical protein